MKTEVTLTVRYNSRVTEDKEDNSNVKDQLLLVKEPIWKPKESEQNERRRPYWLEDKIRLRGG